MARVLAVANAKGGVGKTTTTLNLAAALAERKRRVLAIDLDPQASLTVSLGLEPERLVRTIKNALSAEGTPLVSIIETTQEGFYFVPANDELNQTVDHLDGTENRLDALRAVLEPVRDRYDYILLDCPANAGILNGVALAAADQVLIPLTADHLAFQALGWFLTVIKRVKGTANPNLRIAGILFTMLDSGTHHARTIMQTAQQTYGSEIPILATAIQFNVSLRDASLANKSILQFAPQSAAAQAYRSLAKEIEEGPEVTTENELYFALEAAEDAVAQKDVKRAFASYCRATELNPDLVEAWIGRGDSTAEWDDKVRCYGRALTLAPERRVIRDSLDKCVAEGASSATLNTIHRLVTCAQYLEEVKRSDLAATIYQRVTELDPRHVEAWLGRARTAPNVKQSISYIQQCLKANPQNDVARAELEAAQGRLRAEAAQLVEAGIAASRAGDRVIAKTMLVDASELDPQNDRAWLERARIATDLEEASRLAERALEINPRNAEARELSQLLHDPEGTILMPTPTWQRVILPMTIIVVLIAVTLYFALQANPIWRDSLAYTLQSWYTTLSGGSAVR